jgi:hypothetical protein
MGIGRLLAGIFFCSASAISFEITLTRVFSISLWYHFAFMVLSIAMLGLGLSGTVLALWPELKKRQYLGIYALGLAVSVVAGYVGTNLVPFDPARLAWDRHQLLYIGLYYAFLSVPFLFFGLVVSASFALESPRASLIYGADLLGAGLGSVAAIVLMAGLGPETGVFAITACALLGAFVLGRPRSALLLALLLIITPALSPDFMRIRLSEYKGLEQALRFPGAKHLKTYYSGFSRVDTFESSMVRFAPGMSLKFLEELPRQIGLSVDGTELNAITDAGGDTEFLRHLPAALPYEIRQRDAVLVVEPGGGLPVLLARQYGAGDIESAESNPLVVDVIRRDYGKFSGGIYDAGTFKKLARSRLRSTSRLYDVIDISLTSPLPSGSFGMSEDYALTKEAFEQYITHLTGDGVLSLNMFLIPPPRTELRLLTTAIAALEELGISVPREHMAAIRSWGSICVLVKRTAFSPEEISALKGFTASRNFDLVYYPGIREDETNIYVQMPEGDYYRAFKSVIELGTRGAFLRDYIFDITPVTDEKPFFHHYLRLGRLKETQEVMGGKWQFFIEEGYLLPVVLAQVLVLSFLLLVLPALKSTERTRPSPVLLYFAFLGLGFMFVEVPLIQGMILPLENPSYAVAVVLAAVLICSGAGSLLSEKFSSLRTPRTVITLAALVIPYGLGLTALAGAIAAYSLPVKFVLSFLLVAPAAALMGIPFPMGMRLLGEKSPVLIPWAWAVNGCFSVLAPILATMLALGLGFKAVFLAGALMYAGAFLVIKKAWTSD